MSEPNSTLRASFSGVTTALVTPFLTDGSIDYDGLAKLIDEQIAAGITALVPCGSTGEAATLSHQEHRDLFAFVVREVAGKTQVIAGTGSNSTREAVEMTRQAEAAGVDAALLITPYYNKPTQEGLYQHFKTVAEATGLPVLLYDIPGRTAVKLAHSTLTRLIEITNIAGLKDATGSLINTAEVRRLAGSDFLILSGDDALTLPMLAVGADGVISVSSHLVAGPMIALYEAFQAGDLDEAQRIHLGLLPLMEALFLETNPTPVKLALQMTGRIANATPRLPLVEPTTATAEKLRAVLSQQGLL